MGKKPGSPAFSGRGDRRIPRIVELQSTFSDTRLVSVDVVLFKTQLHFKSKMTFWIGVVECFCDFGEGEKGSPPVGGCVMNLMTQGASVVAIHPATGRFRWILWTEHRDLRTKCKKKCVERLLNTGFVPPFPPLVAVSDPQRSTTKSRVRLRARLGRSVTAGLRGPQHDDSIPTLGEVSWTTSVRSNSSSS